MRSDRQWAMAVPPETLWSLATAHERYRSWWPWLRELHADGFHEGARWRCVVKPPLPYTVHLTITLDEVAAPARVLATVGGDVRGQAELTIEPAGEGSRARLVSRLAPANGTLQAFARIARPLVRFGHDWVLDRGARQFTARALPEVAAEPEHG